jgi:hypothetical protein
MITLLLDQRRLPPLGLAPRLRQDLRDFRKGEEMNALTLKDCPLCGGESSFIMEQENFGPWKYVAACTCGVFSKAHIKREDTAKDWNGRVDYINETFGGIGLLMRAAWKKGPKP